MRLVHDDRAIFTGPLSGLERKVSMSAERT
jgi:hypothetical protein